MDLNYFIFGDVKSNEYNAYISGDEAYSFPEEEYEMVEIPGRDGDLAIRKKRHKNIKIKYETMIFADNEDNFDIYLTELVNRMKALHGYQRLETTYHKDEFRLGVFYAPVDVKAEDGGREGEFDLIFDCKPQRFLKSGEATKTYTDKGKITNPTLFASKPLIKVTGTGKVGIGNETITITGTSSQTVYIDSEIQECYEVSGSSTINANTKVSFTGLDFPELQTGTSGISLGSGISRVEIIPRWCRY